ncbi:Tn3 family transposase [Klebsiella michiganensis]|uniref:Tn3 family transposase n=1 Tax=Klebsiella michiganensis TaxID=1134687 RepID=UPI00388DDF04
MDGLHPALRPPEVRRPGQGQKPVADHDPRRRDQPGPDQDGGIVPRHDRQAGWRLQARHIRDETYGAALAELVNAQFRHPFAGHWGDGTTSSSDGQNFRTGSKAESTGHINPKYGSSPGRTFYTHISDQYAPFHTKVVNVGVRDSTYVLDGLLYHESDLRIEEHYTDTAGFTDHVFALMHLLGFRFAPRIRDRATPSSTSRRAMPPTRR